MHRLTKTHEKTKMCQQMWFWGIKLGALGLGAIKFEEIAEILKVR